MTDRSTNYLRLSASDQEYKKPGYEASPFYLKSRGNSTPGVVNGYTSFFTSFFLFWKFEQKDPLLRLGACGRFLAQDKFAFVGFFDTEFCMLVCYYYFENAMHSVCILTM